MAIRFSLYFQSEETGEYLQKVINSTSQAILAEAKPLSQLAGPEDSGSEAIFLEYQEDNPNLDRWIEKTASDPQAPHIFLYLKEISTASLWKALRLGVKECFTYPIGEEEFREALERLPRILGGPQGLEATCVISFLGCKGGVGTTFLTVNTAQLLAQEHQRQVLVVDLNLHFSQIPFFLDAQPKYTLMDLINNLDGLDVSYLRSLFYGWGENLYLLPAPARLEDAETITPEQVEKVLRFLKHLRYYRFILLDLTNQIHELTLKALEFSDKLVLVVTQSIPALSNAKKLLELLQMLNFPDLKVEVVLNAWQKRGDLDLAEIQGFLGQEVGATVVGDHTLVARSINEGRPLVEQHPGHVLCRDLQALTARLGGEEGDSKNRAGPSWVKRWLRRA